MNRYSFILTLTFLGFQLSSLQSQNTWQQLGGGANMEVFALSVYNGELVAAGIFDTVGGVKVNRIARWNGTTWAPLGSGTRGGYFNLGIVRCLSVYNGELVAGGYFDSAGSVFSRGIAKWNGTSWSALGSGMGGANPFVEALTVFNNELVAGGTFSSAGGAPIFGIARWNGSVWQSLGSGTYPHDSSGVYALSVYNNQLVAGGDFQQAGGVGTNYIGRWNGSTWSPLGTGIMGILVKCLSTYGGQLVVGGSFYQAGSVAANNIARWNGTTWSTFGTGTNGDVYALQIIGANMYAGGFFSYCNGIPASRLAMWNGTTWAALGVGSANGTNDGAMALTNYPVSSSVLVCGGSFTSAGGFTARHLAMWGNFTSIQNTGGEVPKDYSLEQNYPNPFNPETNIRFSVPVNSAVKLTIFDESGKIVDRLLDENLSSGNYQLRWNATNLSSGAYFCRIEAGTFIKTIKMSVLK